VTEPRFRPPASPLVRASLHLHWLAALALLAAPRWWTSILGVVVADHLLLTAGSLWPRSAWVGRNLRRLPASHGAVALTFDDGPDPEGTSRVLDLLERHGASASFFLVGRRAEAAPALVAEIAARGHAVENHSYGHSNAFCLYPPARAARDLARCQRILTELSGRAPRWFRAPAGLRNPWLDGVLRRQGLRLASWTRRGFDTTTDDPAKVAARLRRDLAPGDVLLLHDRSPSGRAALPLLLETIERRGLRATALPRDDASR
jgi:peptidoglycan/xylan/chitin deacetylase (PgdA/CDA1 family)